MRNVILLGDCEPPQLPGNSSQVNVEFKNFRSSSASNFKIVNYSGVCDGSTPLTADYDESIIRNREVTIKRFKCVFYNDGVTPAVNAIQSTTYPAYTAGTYLIVPADGLLLPEFIFPFTGGPLIRVAIDGTQILFMDDFAGDGYDPVLDFDLLYIKHQSKVQNGFTIVIDASIPENFTNPVVPNVCQAKVTLELYLDYPY